MGIADEAKSLEAPAAPSPAASKPLTNRAGDSKSPYVRSKARGPVKWQLLDDVAVEAAKAENKLIFLHIGYQACHYCHLMATESFSHPECASILNKSFVPVVVDREERPDIDTIYMNYVQAVTSAGGWPLNLFLTPDLEPVFGGTYWPGPGTDSRSGLDDGIDLLTILKKVEKIWLEQESRCRIEAKDVVIQLREFAAEGTLGTRGIRNVPHAVSFGGNATEKPDEEGLSHPADSELDLDQLEEACMHIAGTFDPVYGGFGLAPKFPTPQKLAFLLNLSIFPTPVQDVVGESDCAKGREMALETLRKVRDGAMRDHVGGAGIMRFSLTADWSVPNFEKLTVDNALLLRLYVLAWQLSGGQKYGEFYDMTLELADYLSSPPIALPGGGFVSSEAAVSPYHKADTNMREGAYYLWTRREFDNAIGVSSDSADVAQVAATYWDVREHGNVEQDQDPNDEFMNQNILRVVASVEDLSKQTGLTDEKIRQMLATAKARLAERRAKDRVRPEIDDKVIAGWNGLVVSALAKAAQAIGGVDKERAVAYLAAAKAAVEFVKKELWDDGAKMLYRLYRDGRADTMAFADDYSFLVEGLLDLYDATKESPLVGWAKELQESQIAQFYDSIPHNSSQPASIQRSSCGAFYSTREHAPQTILRLKDGIDTSLPSTNSVAVSNLFRLGVLLSDGRYVGLARETISAFEVEILQYPWLFPGLLAGVVWARLGVDGKGW